LARLVTLRSDKWNLIALVLGAGAAKRFIVSWWQGREPNRAPDPPPPPKSPLATP